MSTSHWIAIRFSFDLFELEICLCFVYSYHLLNVKPRIAQTSRTRAAQFKANLVRDSCWEYVKCSPYDDDYIWEALIKLETIQIWREKHDVCLHMRPDRNHHVLRFKIRSERAKKDLHMILNTIFVSLKYSPFLRELLNMVFAV